MATMHIGPYLYLHEDWLQPHLNNFCKNLVGHIQPSDRSPIVKDLLISNFE
jgi:hypothetical protein